MKHYLLIVIFSTFFYSCSNPNNKLQGRWEQSTQYSTSGDLNASLVKEDNDFVYWKFDGDTLEMDGERVPYRITDKELTFDMNGDPIQFEIYELTTDRLLIKKKTQIFTPRKFYSFKK